MVHMVHGVVVTWYMVSCYLVETISVYTVHGAVLKWCVVCFAVLCASWHVVYDCVTINGIVLHHTLLHGVPLKRYAVCTHWGIFFFMCVFARVYMCGVWRMACDWVMIPGVLFHRMHVTWCPVEMVCGTNVYGVRSRSFWRHQRKRRRGSALMGGAARTSGTPTWGATGKVRRSAGEGFDKSAVYYCVGVREEACGITGNS